jgi:hypothetical protein
MIRIELNSMQLAHQNEKKVFQYSGGCVHLVFRAEYGEIE